MKTRLLTIGLLVSFLSGCATTPARDASNTDLQLIRIGVKHLTQKRSVEGPIQHRDEAEDNGQLWNFAGQLEAKSELDDGDKDRLRSFIDEALDAIEGSRRETCGRFNLICRWGRRGDP